MSLFTTQGLFISNTHKSASFPFSRLPLFMPRIFAGLDVIEAISFTSLTDLLWKSSKAKGKRVSTPVAPVVAWEKVNLFDSTSSGLWSETITSIVPSLTASTSDCLSFSVLRGGESFRKVLKSPISFSFNDKLLIETPTVKILPSFLAFLITEIVFSDDICEMWYLH